ncbi:hypothetical protein PQX77_018042 [Marasmius sp. AFHP31]|nr:hypothetical protein PQX77_018042 [Marasmius sp. AFHP31]
MGSQRVDDSEIDKLKYLNEATDWVASKTEDEAEYLSTSHGSSREGSTLEFQFNGTSVEVKGTVLKQKQRSDKIPVATFVVDQSGQSRFEGKPSNDNLYQQAFYSNLSLQADRQHTLIMSVNDPDSRIWFDYIDYTPTGLATDLPPTSSTTPDGAAITNPPQNNADDKGVSTGLVAGVSVGAATLTALIVIGLWWLQRRKRTKHPPEGPMTTFMHPGDPAIVTSTVQRESSHVQPYPISMSPSGGLGKTQAQYIPHQYGLTTSASGSGQEQSRGNVPEPPPYRKRA